MDDRVKLKVMGITYSQIQNGAYALVLAEENGDRRIPIIIGTAEAQSIAIRLEHLTPPRPMTHDLFASFAQGFGIRLREVFVYHYEDGVFSSELLFDDGTRQIRIDSRTSDAIAIALRTQSPIYTTEKIINEAGIIFQEEPKEKKKEETKTAAGVADRASAFGMEGKRAALSKCAGAMWRCERKRRRKKAERAKRGACNGRRDSCADCKGNV